MSVDVQYRHRDPHDTNVVHETSEPPEGEQKGEVNMDEMNAIEALVQQTREAERLRILLILKECDNLEEATQRVADLLKQP